MHDGRVDHWGGWAHQEAEGQGEEHEGYDIVGVDAPSGIIVGQHHHDEEGDQEADEEHPLVGLHRLLFRHHRCLEALVTPPCQRAYNKSPS